MRSTLLVFALLLTSIRVHAGDEDANPHPVFPSPRQSGQGRLAFAASNVQLLGWQPLAAFPGANVSGNDCWGYSAPSGREYALIGLSNGTGFVEVTDPGAPVVVDFESGPSSLWRGIKTYSTYAYAISEGGGGIQVFDLANIDGGVVTLANTILSGGFSTATHTLAIDAVSGFLYRAGGSSQGLVIYDLANPASPNPVGQWHTLYVHECQVVTWDVAGPYFGKQLAFCFVGYNGALKILDVTNKAAITEISTFAYPGAAYAHQGWVSADKQHLYLDDELDDGGFGGARTRMLDISNLAAPSYVGSFSGAPSIDHNLYVKANRIYESNYRSGLRVFDNTNPVAPAQIGFFDTYPEDDAQQFNSLWSNYPYFASGTIIGSDIEKGLFVWREGAAKLSFSFPSGLPTLLDPAGGALTFEVLETNLGDLQAGTVKLHYATGGAFTSVSATPLGGDLYQVQLPGFGCGTQVEFYVSAGASDGVTWTDPPAAPTQVNLANAAYSIAVVLEDALETNSGWLASAPGDTAVSGLWTRVNPVGTSAAPEDDHTSGPGVFCFVTGQGAPGGAAGDSDVDGGVTTLRTPLLGASGFGEPHVSYWRWFSNYQDIFNINDSFVVDISNDGGASWVNLETVVPGDPDALGGWIRHEARIADFVAPTNLVQLRFKAQDLGSGSIVEAAIDDLQVLDYDCTPVSIATLSPATGPFDGGNVITITGAGFQAGVTSVRFGANLASAVNVLSPTQLQVRVPRAPGPVGGKTGQVSQRVDVLVANPGSALRPNGYTYQLKQKGF
ncbi:MAG: choice-of-anchor B family protein [Planctomycetes bacterium]|nr:choice-of-anchor B family protein [Planctomycetota bacterium]